MKQNDRGSAVHWFLDLFIVIINQRMKTITFDWNMWPLASESYILLHMFPKVKNYNIDYDDIRNEKNNNQKTKTNGWHWERHNT